MTSNHMPESSRETNRPSPLHSASVMARAASASAGRHNSGHERPAAASGDGRSNKRSPAAFIDATVLSAWSTATQSAELSTMP